MNNRTQVITKIETIEFVKDKKYEGMYEIQINLWELVPFKYDGENFYYETVSEGEKEKRLADKETKSEQEMIAEFKDLPKILEPLKLYYMKDYSNFINMKTIIDNLLDTTK